MRVLSISQVCGVVTRNLAIVPILLLFRATIYDWSEPALRILIGRVSPGVFSSLQELRNFCFLPESNLVRKIIINVDWEYYGKSVAPPP